MPKMRFCQLLDELEGTWLTVVGSQATPDQESETQLAPEVYAALLEDAPGVARYLQQVYNRTPGEIFRVQFPARTFPGENHYDYQHIMD